MDMGSRRAEPILTHRANEHNHVLYDMCVLEGRGGEGGRKVGGESGKGGREGGRGKE